MSSVVSGGVIGLIRPPLAVSGSELLFIEEALQIILAANAGVTALIGSAPLRAYPLNAPQSTGTAAGPAYPVLVRVLLAWDAPARRYEAPGRNGLTKSTFRFISIGRTYESVKRLDRAVRLALEGYVGTVSNDASSVEVSGVFREDSREFFFDDTQLHNVISDYSIHHSEPIEED